MFEFFGGKKNTAALLVIALIALNKYLGLGLDETAIYGLVGTAVGVSAAHGAVDVAKEIKKNGTSA